MSYKIVKTEHNGPKRGQGAWERKAYAKLISNKARRQNDKIAAGDKGCLWPKCSGCFKTFAEGGSQCVKEA